ncbi:MAG: hypothetical protein IJG23_02235 [Clostridia bacterium]|nr:hypothetical protein [Clostridia bacterium]
MAAKEKELTNAESIYNYMMSQPVPEQWSTPATLKASYQNTVGAANAYQPQINTALRQYGSFEPVTSTREYRNLLDMYNKEYQQRAALAAAETVKASQAANAGFGDTYSKAATDQAYSAYMADRGAAVPTLQAAAADAYNANKNALAAGINAMNNQRDIRMRALQSLFGSQLSGIQKERAAKQQAYSTRLASLADLYAYQYGIENPTSSGGSSGGGGNNGGGYQTSFYEQQQETPKTQKNNHQSMDGRRKDAWTIYDNAIKIYPGLKGKLQPPGHNRDSGSFMDGYANYVQKQIDNHKKNISARRKK